jgi:cytochrome c peroxidase
MFRGMRSGRVLRIMVASLLALPWIATAADPVGYQWKLPRGFPEPHVPADNPMSDVKVALGRRLFFDPQLSITGTHSCASCHQPERAFSDARARSVGAKGELLAVNAMALINVAYNVSYGWSKPSLRSLEAQMLEPLLNEHPVEMGLKGREAQVVIKLLRDESYARAFATAYPGTANVSFDHLVKAIAAFERTMISGDSNFDRYVFAGDHAALSEPAKRGMSLFFSKQVGCATCHSGFNFSGNWRDIQGATGEPTFASNGASKEPMRVPTLRNIALTSPYMHDGRFSTLNAVLDHYDLHAAQGDPRFPIAQLTGTQRGEMIAFLEGLTDRAFLQRFVAQ